MACAAAESGRWFHIAGSSNAIHILAFRSQNDQAQPSSRCSCQRTWRGMHGTSGNAGDTNHSTPQQFQTAHQVQASCRVLTLASGLPLRHKVQQQTIQPQLHDNMLSTEQRPHTQTHELATDNAAYHSVTTPQQCHNSQNVTGPRRPRSVITTNTHIVTMPKVVITPSIYKCYVAHSVCCW